MWEGDCPCAYLDKARGLTHPWGQTHELGKILPLEVVSSLLFFVHISCICGSWTEFITIN